MIRLTPGQAAILKRADFSKFHWEVSMAPGETFAFSMLVGAGYLYPVGPGCWGLTCQGRSALDDWEQAHG